MTGSAGDTRDDSLPALHTGEASDGEARPASITIFPALGRVIGWPIRVSKRLRAPSPEQAALAIFFLLAIVALLSFWPVGSTRISLNVTSETITIIAGPSGSTSQILLNDVTWEGGSTLQFPDGSELETDRFDLSGPPVTVPNIRLQEGGRLLIRSEDRNTRYYLNLIEPTRRLLLALPQGASVRLVGEEPRVFQGEGGGYLRVAVLDRGFTIRGSIPQPQRLVEAIAVRELAFWREDSAREGGEEFLSTVRDGLLILEEAGGRRIELREGEPLRLGALLGTLRSVTLEDGLVHIQFDGWVDDIRSGYRSDARSLMPSWLDRIVNIPQVKAILAVVAVLLGSSLPLWRKRRE